MRAFKQRISNIKRKAEEKLPAEGDILDFPGITRQVIVSALDEIHALAQGIEVRDNGTLFPIIALKRLEDKVKDDLDDFLSDGAKSKDKLNKFVDKLAQLYEKTKTTYYIVSKDGYYTEIELSKLLKSNQTISELHAKFIDNSKSFHDDYESAKALVEEWQEGLDAYNKKLDECLSNCTKSENTIVKLEQTSNSKSTAIDAMHESIESIHESTEEWNTEIEAARISITTLEKSFNTLHSSLSSLDVRAKNITTTSEKLEARNSELLKQILDTLATANRAGLAASFREMKEELQKKQTNWQIIFVSSLGLLTLIVGILLFTAHDNSILNWQKFLGKIPIASPAVWLAWFSARQYSLINRVREDYGFKYSVSMAFEGYKKASEEVDPEMVKNLLKLSVLNISENPIRLYAHPSQDHASPITEFIERALNPFRGKSKIKTKDFDLSHESASTSEPE